MDPGPDAATRAWTPVRTADGSWTLAHPEHGETCHSISGAWQQASERYAAGCRLRARAEGGGTLRLLDVGTGLGLNLAAALAALEGTAAELDVVSLELRADVIRAALALAPASEAVERWHAPVRLALERALERTSRGAHAGEVEIEARGVRARLRLVLGDARATLPSLADDASFDAIFLDPFSPRREPDLWQPEFLADVARRLAPGGLLATYTSALRVRIALARGGLAIGAGPRVGTKASGTLAARGVSLPPLEPRASRRIARAIGARDPSQALGGRIPDRAGVRTSGIA